MDFSLCIGLDKYISLRPPTPYAENDANGFHEIMENIFKIENAQSLIGNNATLRTIQRAIKQISSKIEDSDRFIFFYAGHGTNFSGVPHLSAYDSDDEEESWISLYTIFEEINSKCKRSLYFVDACESTLALGARKTKIDKFKLDQLIERTSESEYCCVFSATSHKGVADIIPDEKHGIFSHYLLKAFTGKVSEVIREGKYITNNSLKDYLSDSVKKYCKTNPNSMHLQTPFGWGKDQGEIIIHEFNSNNGPIAYSEISEKDSNRIAFIAKKEIKIRDLSGFKKGIHSIPKFYTASVERFINSISKTEIHENVEQVAQSLKNLFDLRNKDFKVDIDNGGGSGRFECPYCFYDCYIEIDEDNLDALILTMRLQPIDLSKIYEVADELDDSFPHWFDFLMYDLPKRIDIEDLIDKIEDSPKLKEKLNLTYPSDNSYLTIYMKDGEREITIRSNEIEIYFHATENVPSMIDGLKDLANKVAEISGNVNKILE
ncbi:caspase family protein [Leptospira sp. B5-022]|uniref:caspase family protein n=2 Tax=unclassified Leptospira TaxID=2633828 RepID=UPI0002BE090A|nr:caspase family protein [Leptospira sp. B5-022]EMK01224.1 caspase domain protein [Leptospira sp. B5-022]